MKKDSLKSKVEKLESIVSCYKALNEASTPNLRKHMKEYFDVMCEAFEEEYKELKAEAQDV